ncbi:hypothetical protein DOTSEDRAFT_73518 [Dothistroma septosporum NZE10]|uniref:Uncharacterized protein n=1 Tax=Dothistroma septosporum (strain NZE10 / CBS 128990) TaxID=675120 RepID=N1PKX2_DOTSN|nr:hypothetical protein DOTSEDRAFT_73518 [Dothistroma septosporum NZE10]
MLHKIGYNQLKCRAGPRRRQFGRGCPAWRLLSSLPSPCEALRWHASHRRKSVAHSGQAMSRDAYLHEFLDCHYSDYLPSRHVILVAYRVHLADTIEASGLAVIRNFTLEGADVEPGNTNTVDAVHDSIHNILVLWQSHTNITLELLNRPRILQEASPRNHSAVAIRDLGFKSG